MLAEPLRHPLQQRLCLRQWPPCRFCLLKLDPQPLFAPEAPPAALPAIGLGPRANEVVGMPAIAAVAGSEAGAMQPRQASPQLLPALRATGP